MRVKKGEGREGGREFIVSTIIFLRFVSQLLDCNDKKSQSTGVCEEIYVSMALRIMSLYGGHILPPLSFVSRLILHLCCLKKGE